ncbi:PAS domain S-box protein [Leisingera methylohalidivorans]|nr:PAS domain S-box protein [Leisingera methylohalidivorans]
MSILDPKDRIESAFEMLLASDTRACLLVTSTGIVRATNPPFKRAHPDLAPGNDLGKHSTSPEAVAKFLSMCARTRGPLPGKITLKTEGGGSLTWSCNGGAAGPGADGGALVILRLQPAELGKAAFEQLNLKIRTLKSEIEWRNRAEQARAHLAAIVSSSTDAIYSKDMADNVTSWNDGAENMFGYSAQEIVGQTALCLVPEEKRDEEAMFVRRVGSGETLRAVETLRRCKDGRLLQVSVTPSPIRNEAGEIIGISKIVRDISVRKKVERSLLAANASLAQLVNESPFGIYAVDADFRIAQVSVGAQKVFENVRPLIGRDFAEALRIIWPEPAASEFIAHFRHTLATGEAYHAPDTVGNRHDIDQVEAYDWKIERLTLPDGRPGVVCHFYDLSERQNFEAALRESEQRFRGTFDNASVGIAHIGLDGTWLEFNDRLCEMSGYSRTDLPHRRLDQLLHPEDRPVDPGKVDRLLSGTIANLQYEARHLCADGSDVWWDVSVALQRNGESEPAYLIYVIRDVSDRKAAQEHQNILMHELSHRSKNQLAVVGAIARQTARTAGSMQDFRALLEQRLNGLAVSIDLLVKQSWTGASLRDLIDKQLEAFAGGGERLERDGPEVVLNSNEAEVIGLAMHELSTNCVKYGAWSTPEGKVHVEWGFETHDEKKVLRLSWTERGGPPVSAPEKTGFGQTVIKSFVSQKLGANVDLAYAADGLQWTVMLPFDR